MRLSLTPSSVIAGAALFFALGGSALAVSEAVKPQARCANGAVRGFASVTGEPTKGIANLGDQFTASKAVFAQSFNCVGKGTQVRRADGGVFEVRFVANTTQVATVTPAGGEANVQSLGGGTFRITLRDGNAPLDVPFMIVAG
jgi:hypothetical protein